MKIKKPDVAGSLIKIFEILIIPSLSVTWEEGGDQVQLPVVPPPCPILDPPHPDPTQCTTLTPLPTLPNSIPTLTILSSGCRKRVYTFWVLCYICFARYKQQRHKVTWKNTMGGLPSDSDSGMFVLRLASFQADNDGESAGDDECLKKKRCIEECQPVCHKVSSALRQKTPFY